MGAQDDACTGPALVPGTSSSGVSEAGHIAELVARSSTKHTTHCDFDSFNTTCAFTRNADVWRDSAQE
jgi:hypothetical protein